MKVLSYNLQKHRAAGELAALVSAHDPDILCLQECDVAVSYIHLTLPTIYSV